MFKTITLPNNQGDICINIWNIKMENLNER